MCFLVRRASFVEMRIRTSTSGGTVGCRLAAVEKSSSNLFASTCHVVDKDRVSQFLHHLGVPN